MPPSEDPPSGQVDPREWLEETLAESRLADSRAAMTDPPPPIHPAPPDMKLPTAEDIAAVVRAELLTAVASFQPLPKPVSPWTPKSVGALLTTFGTVITTIVVGLSQVSGASERDAARTRTEIKASIETAIDAHAKVEAEARGEVTTRLTRVEKEQRWTTMGLCVVNGKRLHPDQPCGLEVTTTQRGPGAEVREAYGRLPTD